MKLSYIRHSIETVKSTDVQQLAELDLKKRVGAGSWFHFRPIGVLPTQGTPSEVSAGLKLPHSTQSANERFLKDVAFMSLAIAGEPLLNGYFPSFAGLIQIAGQNEPAAILTEDVSANHQNTLTPIPTSDSLRSLLSKPFETRSVRVRNLVHHDDDEPIMTFDVGGVEKLLDLTPSPIDPYFLLLNKKYMKILRILDDLSDELTVTIPETSPLAIEIDPYLDPSILELDADQ